MKTDYDQIFLKKYGRLNAGQKKAVDTIDGPVMVIAGPGTGKTTILTLRIANILRRTDTPPSGILAITYTDAGVKSIRQKLFDTIGTRAHEVQIHTFHSFAAAMIAEYPDHFLETGDYQLVTNVEQESLVNKIIADPQFADLRPMGRPDAYVSSILRAISDSKKEALTYEMVLAHAKAEIDRVKNDPDSISTRGASKGKLKADAEDYIEKCRKTILFSEVYKKYEELKAESKMRDFDDLIITLLVALRNDELLLRLVQERFLYIMIDEHQDTNDSQNLIVTLIAEFFETPNVFIVGDEKQAIYRFQGASVENFLNLKNLWKNVEEIKLDMNYRSHQSILDASFSMIENNYDGDEHKNLRVKLQAGGEEAERPIDVITGENAAAIEGYLVSELQKIIDKEPAATVAVITRRNRDLERVIRLLESNHIPVSSERSIDIFHHPVGVVFFDLIEYLADPARTDALARTIAAGMWNVPLDEMAQLMKALRSGSIQGLSLEIPALVQLQKDAQNDGGIGYLVNAASVSGFSGIVSRDPAAVHVWRGIITLAESLAREGNVSNPADLMRAMLAYRLSAESKTVKVSVGAPDLPIQAMTAHGSKGLEFDYVFIPYATEESWVGRARGASFILPQKRVGDNDIRDVRRLFYVAITRAKKHAAILALLEESDGKALTPLRFIAELDLESVATVSLPRVDAALPIQRSDLVQDDTLYGNSRAAAMTSLAQRVLMESGLSVTALNHFLECPNKFLYQSILKLPQAPSAAAEKGTAMHVAMANIWKEENRTSGRIKEIILESVAEYLNTSFLPASEKESVKKDLFDDAPAVSMALQPHFITEPNTAVFTERWSKTAFEGKFKAADGEKMIAIPLHGKLDAVLDTGNELKIFDYKTREGMSENEIRGLTKNSDGGYFRQLVFYKMLLSDEPRWKTRKISPALVFISPDKKGRCPITTLPITSDDIAAVKSDIEALINTVWSGELVTKKCDDSQCEWCALAKVSFL